jgi:hypothetical protein
VGSEEITVVDPVPAYDEPGFNHDNVTENGPDSESRLGLPKVAPVFNASWVYEKSVFDASVRPNDDGPESEVEVEVEVEVVAESEFDVVAESEFDVVAESEVAAKKTTVS